MEAITITSRQNPQVLHVRSLWDKKHRDASAQFFFEGAKLLEEAIARELPVSSVFVTQQAQAQYAALLQRLAAQQQNVTFFCTSDSVYQKMSPQSAPQGILCVANRIDKLRKFTTIYSGDLAKDRILLCECIQDPGNLGTVLRTAAAFGYDSVVLTADCADTLSYKVIQASMGASFSLPVQIVPDLGDTIRALRASGRYVAAAALHRSAISLEQFAQCGDAVFAVGSEGRGLQEETVSLCSACVAIPMAQGAESLNAAMAATVLMWEQYRANGCKASKRQES